MMINKDGTKRPFSTGHWYGLILRRINENKVNKGYIYDSFSKSQALFALFFPSPLADGLCGEQTDRICVRTDTVVNEEK